MDGQQYAHHIYLDSLEMICLAINLNFLMKWNSINISLKIWVIYNIIMQSSSPKEIKYRV